MSCNLYLIVDSQYKGDLAHLLSHGPIWIVRSEHNDELVRRLRETPVPLNMLTDFDGSETPLASFEGILWTVDLHHGEYSDDNPWQHMHVIGLELEDVDVARINDSFEFPVTVEREASGFFIARAE